MSDLWITIVASIPVSIASGLLVSPIKRVWEGIGKKAGEARMEWRRKAYREVLFYVGNPDLFTQRLLYFCIRILLGTTLFAIVNLTLLTALYVIPKDRPVHLSLRLQVFTAVGLLLLYVLNTVASINMGESAKALTLYRHVTKFQESVARLPGVIRHAEAEKEALRLRNMWHPPDYKSSMTSSSE